MWDWIAEKIQGLFWWLMGSLALVIAAWSYPTLKSYWQASSTPAVTSTVSIPVLDIGTTQALIKRAEHNIQDAKGWAADLLDALQAHQLPQTRENVCSVIAVASQESGFVANPAIPNLGKVAEQAIADKLSHWSVLGNGATLFLSRFPTPQNSFMQRIRKAKTERDLDLAYRDLIKGVENYARQYKLSLLIDNRFARNLIEGNNDIDTIGSMQVAVAFAIQYEQEKRNGKALSLAEIYQLRDQLYTRKGGLFYGSLLLLGYESGYDKKLYRFADFNAGRYSSRNAAFQAIIGELLNKELTTDGDLLIYQKDGDIANTISGTEQAVHDVINKYALGLSDFQVRRDFMREKQLDFIKTPTYIAINQAYKNMTGKTPVFAIVPNITLHSEKTSRILTTSKFASSVYARYQRCMAPI